MRLLNLVTLIFLTCSFLGLAVSGQDQSPTGLPQPAGQASVPAKPESDVEGKRASLIGTMQKYRDGYNAAQWRYSWAYHFCVYVAALLGALAAWISKVHVKKLGLDDPARRDNWTASMAAGATLLIAISTAGGLAGSWQDNKKKRYAVESIIRQFEVEQDLTYDEIEAYGKRFALVVDPDTDLVVPIKKSN